MVNPIPKFAKNIWSKWNIRGVILMSLSLQIVLIFIAPFRKRTRKRILVLVLWSTYLVADYTANFCVGLISNKYGDEDTPISNTNDFLLAFWTPFLLLHLGGPDTITAFALEDNELWLRHLLGLVVQVCLTGYVFLLTLPENTLWVPTTLVFIAGIIKFAERTRSLQLASASNFRQSMVRKADPGPNYAKLMDEYKSRREAGLPATIVTMPEIADQPQNTEEQERGSTSPLSETSSNTNRNEKLWAVKMNLCHVEVVRKAYHYFNTFKGLVVDMIFSFHERNSSREYFLKQTPVDALRVIEVELNFIYEAFYTKASVVFSKLGFFFRFVSVASVVAALVTFVFDQKRGCPEFDVKVTYTLLYGAVALDAVSLLMLFFSDHSFASFKSAESDKNDFLNRIRRFRDSAFRAYLNFKSLNWIEGRDKKVLGRKFLCRRWSESVSGYNLISHCLHKRKPWLDRIIDYIGVKDLFEQWQYEKKQKLFLELWNFIFIELERKSADADDVETIQRICSSRGEWVIQEGEVSRDVLDKLMPYVDRNSVTFDQCLILWHIATDLLLYGGHEQGSDNDGHRTAPDVEQGGGNGAHKNDQDDEQGGGDGVHKNDQDDEQGGGDGVHNNDQDIERGSENGAHKKDQDVEQGGGDGVHKNDQGDEQGGGDGVHKNDQDDEQGGGDGIHKNDQDDEQRSGDGVHKNDQDNEQGGGDGVHKNDQDDEQGGGKGAHKNDQDVEQGSDNDVHKKAQHVEKGGDNDVNKNDKDVKLYRELSKLLSDYLLYLLIMQPTMMSAVRGIGQIRFQDTCAEAANFFSKRHLLMEEERQLLMEEENKELSKLKTARRTRKNWPISPGMNSCKKFYESIKKFITRGNSFSTDGENKAMKNNSKEKEACKKLIDVCVEQEPSSVKGDRSKSLLFDACRLADELKKIKGVNKWKVIAQIWVELLSYAASNCIPITHVQQLSKGGEFLSLVWLLMTHLGLAKQFQIKEGHARAKLIVGE